MPLRRKTRRQAAKSKGQLLNRKSASSFASADFLATAGDGKTVSKYRKHQKLFVQGEDAHSVFFVLKGQVKISVVSSGGKEAVVAIVDKGGFLGESCLGGQLQRSATARAFSDCEIVCIEKKWFSKTLRAEPTFSTFFLEYTLRRAVRLEEDLVDQLFNSSEKRLARALLRQATFGKEGTSDPLIAKISQATLAKMIGTTRSRVSFFMNKFRKQGFISYGGTIQIHKSLFNVLLNERPSSLHDDIKKLEFH